MLEIVQIRNRRLKFVLGILITVAIAIHGTMPLSCIGTNSNCDLPDGDLHSENEDSL